MNDAQRRAPFVAAVDAMSPKLDPGAWIAPTATVVGGVSLAAGSSVWYNAVLRADDEVVRVGLNTNVQDGAILHADPGFPCTLGNDVTVGHGAIVHGATIGPGTLVGMGARVLNGAQIGARCMIAAATLVPEGFSAPDGVLIVGMPARVRRELDADDLQVLTETSAEYIANARRHRRALNLHASGPSGP